MPTSTEIVMENAEQYIIPECIDCCRILWSKGIDTYQCGNYDDNSSLGFWFEFDTMIATPDMMPYKLLKILNYILLVKEDFIIINMH